MSETNETTNFEKLFNKKLNKLLKKKGKFDYLSWARAWEMMKKNDPEATVTINEYKHYRVVSGTHQDFLVEEYKPYLTDETGTYVSVSVTLKGRTETELFPVTDYNNKPIAKPDASQINNSLKRCFVKSLALHGLGLHVFQGEDIPAPPKIDTKKLNMLEEIINSFNEEMGEDMLTVLIEFVNEQTVKRDLIAEKVKSLEDLTYEQCGLMERAIAKKRNELNKKK
ncbi:DUF1071 domain-containing protein [Enterococcus faecium]|nr:DUF1071 domain-containing protein [Enterococcus faecium]